MWKNHSEKVAVTIPKNLVIDIDAMCRQKGLSRSRFISQMLEEKVAEEKNRLLKEAYDTVFSDESICREQLETAQWFEGTGSKEGQEW